MKIPVAPAPVVGANFLTPLTKTLRDCSTLLWAVGSFTCAANAADLVWSGGSGDWNMPANWSPAKVPTANDNAFITNSGIFTVTVPAGTTATAASVSVGGSTGTQTLAIDRATITLEGASAINSNGHLEFLVAQSVLTGPGDLTVNGTLNWANGTMSGTGATTIGSSGVLVIGNGGVTLSRALNNSGAASWSGGNFTMSGGSSFNNLADGTFDITADGRLSGSATTPINNSGLFRQAAGTAGTIVTAPCNNSGTVAVLAAALNLNLGGTHAGTMSSAPGAILNFGGGSHVLEAGSVVTGGSLSVSGNATTLTASGTFAAGSALSLTAGDAILAPGCNITGATLNISGGVVNYDTSGSVAALNLSGGTLGGTAPVTVTGPLTLGGGTVTNALVTAAGGLTISGNTTLNGGKLVNPGLATWSAGNFTGANGAVFSNLFGATFDNTFDGNAASGSGTTPLFVNEGSFRKSGATAAQGTTSIDFQFLNTGTVEIQTNSLRYGINQQTAGLTLLDGGGLSAQAQPLQLLGGSLVGTGLVTVANAQNIVNSSVISPGLPVGELDISGNYQQTASGTLNIDLGGYTPGTTFDFVTVTAGGAGGVATLGGTLNITLTNGFVPTNGASFTFLTAASRVGSFATFNYPSNDLGMQLILQSTSASVKVTNLKPIVANSILAPPNITYGSVFNFQFPANTFSDPDGDLLTYTAFGMPPGITFNGSTRTFSGSPTQAGAFLVSLAATDTGTPSLAVTNTFTISVDPAPLTIAAQPQSKAYGTADPALTFTATGLQFNDTTATVLTGALARSAGESVTGSPYPITQGTLTANGSYTISFTGSTLAITPATLTVAAQSKTKTYGTLDPALTFTVTGLQFNDTPATALTGALTRAPGETVAGSPYALTRGTLVANGSYNIDFTGSTLAITPATLTVTASAKSKPYGSTLSLNGATDFTSAGLLNGEAIGSVSLIASGSPAGTAATAAVGAYVITPSAATGGTFAPANYAITYATAPLTVNQAALSITADAKSKTYGATDPVFTTTDTGFVNGETAAVLGGTLAFTRAPGESAGSYGITPSGLTSSNYTISFNTGSLAITPAPLTVTASAKAKSYGSTLTLDGATDFTSAGLMNSESIGSVTLIASGSPAGTAATAAVGAYTITPSAATGGTFAPANYAITYATAPLTVNQAALSVTADAQTKIYGANDPVFTTTDTGLVNGETAAVLGGTLAFTRAPGESAGSYVITPSGLTSSNYAITFNSGTLTITRAVLAVTADPTTKTYGAADPVLTFTSSGLRFTDTQGSVLTGALTRTAGESVAGGPYAIAQGTLTANGNYTIGFTGNTLTITPAPLSIIADSKSKSFGAPDPLLTVSYAGFVNGETASALGGVLAITRVPGENVGSYVITPAGVASSNYTITFTSGTLTVIAPTEVVLSLTRTGVTSIALTWGAASNATYRVQYKSDLNSTKWTDLAGDVLANSDTASKTDVLTATNRFYRVQVLP